MLRSRPHRQCPRTQKAWLGLHASVGLFGLAGLFGKTVHLPSVTLVFGRASFAAVILYGVLWLHRRERWARERPSLRELVPSGVVLAFHWVALFQAIQVSSVAVALLTFSSFPLFVTLLEPICFRERFRRADLVSAMGVGLGLALIIPRFDPGLAAAQGAFWGVASGLSFAVLALINRRLVGTYSAVAVAAGQNLYAAYALLLLALSRGVTPSASDLWMLAVLGIFCTALAHVLFINSLSKLRAQVASVVTGLEAVYGILFAFVLLHERPALRTLAGGALVLCAVAFASRRGAAPDAAEPIGEPSS